MKESMILPKAPFCLTKAKDVISGFPPMHDQVVVDDAIHLPLRLGGRTFLAHVRSHGSIEEPRLGVTVTSAEAAGKERVGKVLTAVGRFLSIDDELRPLYDKAILDPPLGMAVARLYGLHQVRFTTPFESTCWALLSAHTPMNMARSMKRALVRAFDHSVDSPTGPLYVFPEPSDIVDMGMERLAGVVRNERKVHNLMSAAEAWSSSDEEFLYRGDYDQVKAWLQEIDGIGPWGSSLVMVRGLGRMERLPSSDKSLSTVVSHAYGHPMTEDEMETHAERYGPWRAYWIYYLRVAYHQAQRSNREG